MMNKLKFNIIGVCASLLALGGCSDFLDPFPYGNFPEENMWKYPDIVEGLVERGYTYLPKDYNNNEGFYLDGATDDAVITSTTHNMSRLATGAINTSNDPFNGYYSNAYAAIGSVNRFLFEDKGIKSRYKLDARQDSLTRTRLQGEAFAIRAWFQWDLLKRFGGKSANDGKLLGFAIVTEPFNNIFEDEIARPRNTYEECMEQIKKDCDSAAYYLPTAHRDWFMETSTDKGLTGSCLWGAFDEMTLNSILSEMYLTYASPLFNTTGDTKYWDLAAEYAKKVIDFKLDLEVSKGGFKPLEGVEWNNPNYRGIVYSCRYQANNSGTESAFYPAGFKGSGAIGATQELVDAFPMSNGYPKDHSEGAKLYDPQNPYDNRDARFYSTIFYNGATANRNTNNEVMYTFDNWTSADGENGKDIAGATGASRTNYYIKKYVFMGYNPYDTSIKRSHHSKFFYRWEQMLLNFAEAANEVEGPNGNKYGLTAKEAIAYLREKETPDGDELYPDEDPYLDEVASQGADAFRSFIHNEKRIETCFEGIRFYDLRRWSKPGDLSLLNGEVHRPSIVKNNDGSFTYNEPVVVESRKYTSPYLPIPYNEMLRVDEMVQNEGWESWE